MATPPLSILEMYCNTCVCVLSFTSIMLHCYMTDSVQFYHNNKYPPLILYSPCFRLALIEILSTRFHIFCPRAIDCHRYIYVIVLFFFSLVSALFCFSRSLRSSLLYSTFLLCYAWMRLAIFMVPLDCLPVRVINY